MQGEKRVNPFFSFVRRVAIATLVLLFLVCFVLAQDLRQRECENLFSAAVRAEQQDDPIEAELRYEECQELAKKYRLPKLESAALHRLAVIRARSNKFSESANLFRRAIALDSRNALILCDFAQLYADRKDYGEAETILKNALNVDPHNPKVLYNLGVVIASQRGERQTEGLRYLKLAVGEADAYRELARIYRANGDIRQAEFAEQKAQLVNHSPGSLANNGESVRLPQRMPHESQTPSEVVDRVRRELIELETREIAESQRNMATPAVAQKPFIPTPANQPNSPNISGANTREAFPVISQGQTTLVSMPPQMSSTTSPPVNPFAEASKQPVSPAASSVRRLEPPSVDSVVLAQSVVRTISSEPSSAPPVPAQKPTINPSTSVPTIENRTPVNETAEPPSIKKMPSAPMESRLPQRTPTSGESNRQISLPPVRVSSNGDERLARTETANPLRKIPSAKDSLIDSSVDTSHIAALPSYSAVGTRRIPRTDQSDLPSQSESIANATESQPSRTASLRAISTAETSDVASAVPRPLPVRDVDVLQSPSAVIAHQETPATFVPTTSPSSAESTHVAENVRPLPSEPATPTQETRMIQSEHRFGTATSPDVIAFAPVKKVLPPAAPTEELPIEVAVIPLKSDTPSSPFASSPVKLPQIATADSDSPKVAVANSTPVAPQVSVFASPFPILDDTQQLAEAKPTASQAPAVSLPMPSVSPAIEPANPFLVANNPPKFADAKTESTALPTPMLPTMRPSEPLSVANNVQKPADTRTEAIPPPAMDVAVRPMPKQEEPAGFATSRKADREIKVSSGNDESTGFARSRR